MGKNVNSKVVSVRLPIPQAEFLWALAAERDVSLNALLCSFIDRRIREIKESAE